MRNFSQIRPGVPELWLIRLDLHSPFWCPSWDSIPRPPGLRPADLPPLHLLMWNPELGFSFIYSTLTISISLSFSFRLSPSLSSNSSRLLLQRPLLSSGSRDCTGKDQPQQEKEETWHSAAFPIPADRYDNITTTTIRFIPSFPIGCIVQYL